LIRAEPTGRATRRSECPAGSAGGGRAAVERCPRRQPGSLPGQVDRRLRMAVATVLALMLAAAAWASDGLATIPPLASRVTDLTTTLSASDRASLEARLAEFERKTKGQLALLVVPTAQPETIEQFALRVAETWKIGRAGADNGIVLVLAMRERKARIEVGRGWEGALPDVEAKRIIREVMAPFFKQGQFAQGVTAGIDKIELAVGREASTSEPAWQKGHLSDPADALWEQLAALAPIGLGVVLVASFFLSPILIGGGAAAATYLMTGSVAATAVWGVVALILAGLLRGIFGSLRRRPLGGRRIHRDRAWGDGPWISTGNSSGWSYGGGSSGDSGWSGGGGDFGGGGASGDW